MLLPTAPAPQKTQAHTRVAGFTLLEMAIVLAIIGVIISGGLAVLTATAQTSQFNATTARIDEINKALLNYTIAFNRLPCPASLTLATTDQNYGVEAASNLNTCWGGTPSATFTASGNITANATVEGALPVRTLKLPDSYMYDAWGRKFRYAVNPTLTATGSFPPPSGGGCPSPSGITVMDATDGANSKYRSTNAAYVVLSHGANGHGGYTKNGVPFNAGSTNPDELINCHCDSTGATTTSSGVQTTSPATYVQKLPSTTTTTNDTGIFDDIVSYRDPWQLQNSNATMASASAACARLYFTAASASGSILSSSGAFVSFFSNVFEGKLTVDPANNLWIVGGSGSTFYIAKLDSNGNQIVQYTNPSSIASTYSSFYPNGIALDKNNHIFVVDANDNAIIEFNNPPGANPVQIFGNTGVKTNGITDMLNDPVNISTDSSGNVWVADNENNRVIKYQISGATATPVLQIPPGCDTSCSPSGTPGILTSPQDVRVNPNDNTIWVADFQNQRVQEFDAAGDPTPVQYFYACSGGGSSLGFVNTIAFDSSNRIYLGTYSLNKISVCTISGNSTTWVTDYSYTSVGNNETTQTFSPWSLVYVSLR